MKRYASRAVKWLAVVTIICGAALLTGIILLFAKTDRVDLSAALILPGGLLGILFLCCYFAEKGRVIIIDADRITFPRGVEIDGKTFYKKTAIRMCEINSVFSNLHRGDGLINKDTYIYTLKLKNGKKVSFTLYAYGEEAERGIIETIRKNIS
jgi:hypothetical protein